MPQVIVAGVPQGPFRRLRSYLRREDSGVRAGWELTVHRAAAKTPGPDVDKIRDILESEEGGGTHVLAFGGRCTRPQTVRELVPFSRFRWLHGNLLQYAAASLFGPFVQRLNEELAVEEEWIDRLRPAHYRNAVLLPAPCFAHDPEGDVWQAIESAEDTDRINAAAAQIERFGERHFQDIPGLGRRWVDLGGLVFDHNGEQHGQAVPSRQWKYAFRIPDGFHYDVVDRERRAFNFVDYEGVRHSRLAGEHANVDPYGYVRG